MTLSQTVVKNLIVSFVGRVYTGILTFAVVAVLLPRVLTPAGFGIYAFYSTLFVILGVIVDFGSNVIAVREGSREPGRLGALVYSLTLIRLVMSLVCLAAALVLAALFEKDWNDRLLIAGASLHILFHTLGGFGVVFHVRMKFSSVALAAAVGHTCFFAAALALYLGRRPEPAYYLFALGGGLAVSNLASYFMGRGLVPGPLAAGRGETARLLKEAFPLGISAVVSIAYFNVDTLLLRPLQGDEAVGLYNASYRLLTFAILIPVLFNQVLLPVYSRLAGDRPDLFRRVFCRAVLYMGAAGLPVCAALLFLAEPVLLLIFPEGYVRSAGCLRILGAAVAVIFLTYPHVSALIASGYQAAFTWIAVAGLVINVALNLVWIPRYSIEGAAWATVVTEAFVLVAAALCVRRLIGFWAFAPGLLKIPAVTAAVGAAAWALKGVSILAALPALALLLCVLMFAVRLLPFDIGGEDRAGREASP